MIKTLTGPNSFMLKQALDSIIAKHVKEHGDLALEKLDGDEAETSRLVEAATSLPFLASKKLVILRNPGSQKQFTEQIEDVLKAMPETNDLVIVEPKIDKRSVYFKVLKAKTEYNEFVDLDSIKLNNWIVQYTKEAGGQISLADARYLAERVGQNQQMLANEIEKLVVYSSDISRESIEELTSKSPQSTIFELLDSAFAGNKKRVLSLYQEQRELKVEPQQIMGMLAWQLNVLAIVKTAGNRNDGQIAKEAKINPYVISKTRTIAGRLSLRDLKNLITEAAELDKRMKTENINADEALQNFLINIL